MFWNGASSSEKNQIAVIGDISKAPPAWKKGDMDSELASNLSSFKAVISDSSAALKVGNATENFICDKGFKVKCVIVFLIKHLQMRRQESLMIHRR